MSVGENENEDEDEGTDRKQAPPARKQAATRSTAKKSTAKKPAAKKPAAKRPAPSRSAPTTARQVADSAADQLAQMTGRESEGVTGLERTDDGWRVQVEVLELRRVPATTDVLAVYEVEVDERGDLLGYRRVHRFARGDAGGER